jgi:hypothetical protein
MTTTAEAILEPHVEPRVELEATPFRRLHLMPTVEPAELGLSDAGMVLTDDDGNLYGLDVDGDHLAALLGPGDHATDVLDYAATAIGHGGE